MQSSPLIRGIQTMTICKHHQFAALHSIITTDISRNWKFSITNNWMKVQNEYIVSTSLIYCIHPIFAFPQPILKEWFATISMALQIECHTRFFKTFPKSWKFGDWQLFQIRFFLFFKSVNMSWMNALDYLST